MNDLRAQGVSLGQLGTLALREGDLAEAVKHYHEALELFQRLDPGAAEIWSTYEILAEIEDQQGQPEPAAEYRRLARDAKRKFAGTAHEMKRHLPVIVGTWQVLQDPAQIPQFQAALSEMETRGWTNLVAAIRRILSGERDAESLCGPLDLEDSMIIETILHVLEDPSAPESLLLPGAESE